MSDAPSASGCLVCDELSGAVVVPGGAQPVGEGAAIFHAPTAADTGDVYPGYLFVVPRRHAARVSDLDEHEAADMGRAVARASLSLELAGAERVYAAIIGHFGEHLHVHVVARWPGTPPEVRWTEVDTWDGARRVDAGSARALVEDLRANWTVQ